MKRIITSALVIMLSIGAAQAQTTSTDKKQGHKKEHKMAFDNLNLSADQKARLHSIREDFKNQSAALKNNTSLSTEQKQARRKELHEQFRSQSAGWALRSLSACAAAKTRNLYASVARMTSSRMTELRLKALRVTTRTGKEVLT